MSWVVRSAQALLWLGVAVGGAWLWLVLTDLRAVDLAPLWTAPRLTPVQARVEHVQRVDGRIELRYRYRVGEQTYRSERLTFDPQRGRSDSGTLADLYLVYDGARRNGLPVTAWVDPQDPSFAVLDKGVQWLPLSAAAAAIALLALLIAAALRRMLQALGLQWLADSVAGPEAPTGTDRFPWGAYRAVALLIATCNVATWTFIPGSAMSLLAALAAAVTLVVPLPHLRRRWSRWRGERGGHAAGDRHWTLLICARGRGVHLLDSTVQAGVWICVCVAAVALAWVGYVLLMRPFHADMLSLLLATLGGLGAAALALLLRRSAVSVEADGEWLRIERARGLGVERLGKIRLRDVAGIERLRDPLGDVAVDATGHWRVFARLWSDGSAAPLTPLLSAELAAAVQAALERAVQQARLAPARARSDRAAGPWRLAPLVMLLVLGAVLVALIGHWQWQRHSEGVRRVLPDGSVLLRKPERDPLQRAIYARDGAAVRALLASGVSVDRPDDEGRRPLHLAVMLRSPEIVTTLIEAGADVNARYVPIRHGKGETPLMWAAGQPQLMALLLAAGADPQLRDDSGGSAMHFAARYNSAAALAMLHERGLSIDDSAPPDGATPLMWAFWWWSPAAIDWLVERGAALDARDRRGFNIDHYARTSKEPELAEERLRQLRERLANKNPMSATR